MGRIPVAVLGATGSVGQRFVRLLAEHPWFELAAVTASARSAGRSYGEVVNWVQDGEIPPAAAALEVRPTAPGLDCPMVFSALDSGPAGPLETAFAEAGHLVVSNASSHRMDPDVPLVVPEVNPDHLELARRQRFGGGMILTNPNCSTIGLVLALKPLADAFGLRRVHVVTLQAVSGAGLPGVPGMQCIDNVIPFIAGEEEKLEHEPPKILGTLEEGGIRPASTVFGAQCTRVPVLDGHTECVSVALGRSPDLDEVRAVLADFSGEPQRLRLPSAPPRPIVVLQREDGPQPRLHRNAGDGMAVTVGRVRPCPILGLKLVVLSHNTVRGAAGGAVLLGELAVARGFLPGGPPR